MLNYKIIINLYIVDKCLTFKVFAQLQLHIFKQNFQHIVIKKIINLKSLQFLHSITAQKLFTKIVHIFLQSVIFCSVR